MTTISVATVNKAVGAVALTFFALFMGSVATDSAPANAGPPIGAHPFQATGGYPEVEAGPDGKPRMECNQFHDGQGATTIVDGKKRLFVCKFYDPIFGDPYWAWAEIMRMAR
ncbi:hypothetical protein [Nocardia sp. NPDC003963]